MAAITELQQTLLTLASTHAGTIMSGYTHSQHAQPITYGHYLLAYVEMFQRDYERLNLIKSIRISCHLGQQPWQGQPFQLIVNLLQRNLALRTFIIIR